MANRTWGRLLLNAIRRYLPRRWRGDQNQSVADLHPHSLQGFAEAGAGETVAGFDRKERAVGGALDQRAVAIEKLVGNPVQLTTQMRAGVAVVVQLVVAAHDKGAGAINQ